MSADQAIRAGDGNRLTAQQLEEALNKAYRMGAASVAVPSCAEKTKRAYVGFVLEQCALAAAPAVPAPQTVEGGKWDGAEEWMPLAWNAKAAREGRRLRVFCASLADVFDNEVPVQWRRDLFDLIEATPNLDWLLLTKRIGNARRLHAGAYLDSARPWPANVWLGATVVSQEEADRDIPKLLEVPARVRFLSIEPMLGTIDLRHLNDGRETNEIDALKPWTWEQEIEAWSGTAPEWEDDFEDWYGKRPAGLAGPMHERIDWVICGGESGPQARPMHPDWVRQLRDQCAAADVPFLFKQWGEWLPGSQARDVGDQMAVVGACTRGYRWDDGTHSWRIGKPAAGRLLDGITHDGFPAPGAAPESQS